MSDLPQTDRLHVNADRHCLFSPEMPILWRRIADPRGKSYCCSKPKAA